MTGSKKLQFRFAKGDWIALYVLLGFIMVSGLSMMLSLIWSASQISFNNISVEQGPRIPKDIIAANAEVHWSNQIEWTINNPSFWQRILVSLPTVWIGLCLIVGALLLCRLTTLLRKDETFTLAASYTLKAIALVVIVGSLLYPFLWIASRFFLSATVEKNPNVLWRLDLMVLIPLIAGLLMFILGNALAQGKALADEVEGLI